MLLKESRASRNPLRVGWSMTHCHLAIKKMGIFSEPENKQCRVPWPWLRQWHHMTRAVTPAHQNDYVFLPLICEYRPKRYKRNDCTCGICQIFTLCHTGFFLKPTSRRLHSHPCLLPSYPHQKWKPPELSIDHPHTFTLFLRTCIAINNSGNTCMSQKG